MVVHPVPDRHVDQRDAGDLVRAPEIVERLAAPRSCASGCAKAEQLQVVRLEDERERLGERGVRHARSSVWSTSFSEKVCSTLWPISWTAML